MEFFYENLFEGMSKEEALRHAKLSYLNQAEGRTLAPQYWAGLILMGDTAAISISKAKSPFFWIFITLGVLLMVLLIYRIRK